MLYYNGARYSWDITGYLYVSPLTHCGAQFTTASNYGAKVNKGTNRKIPSIVHMLYESRLILQTEGNKYRGGLLSLVRGKVRFIRQGIWRYGCTNPAVISINILSHMAYRSCGYRSAPVMVTSIGMFPYLHSKILWYCNRAPIVAEMRLYPQLL